MWHCVRVQPVHPSTCVYRAQVFIRTLIALHNSSVQKMAAVTIPSSLESTVTLNDGVKMPLYGLGVFQSPPGDEAGAEKSVIHALKSGYKMVDTAELYRNEADVGRGIKKSGVKREDIFVVSKVFRADGYDHCQKTFRDALKKLDTGYVDLYLIHSPLGPDNCGTFRAMLDLKKEGLIRSCGVSNYGPHHLEGLKKAGLPLPSVNQIELHPWQRKADIVEYCQKNGIALMGYSPVAQGKKFGVPALVEIAKRNGQTPPLVLLRWSVQKGYITIPKSVTPSRIEENARVFDWSLSETDMKILDGLPEESIGNWNPTVSPWNG